MAKVNCGILDGFMGKVGTVVGSFWKGVPVMRAYNRHHRDAMTEQQILQRMRFKALAQLSSGFLDATVVGMHNVAVSRHMTESNVFTSMNAGAVTATDFDSLNVDFTSLVVAYGPLPQVGFGAANFDTPQQVSVTFKGNTECRYASADDDVYLFAYCPDAECGVLSAPVKRSAGTLEVRVPADWNGLKVHLWGFALGAKTNQRANQTSDSTYIGSGNIG
ncbi:MAG: hypothetical protein IJ634_06010 [Bacteroidales bacterium]|nr:hypothetical protein [Bacteroidales bacterium]